MHTLPIVPVSCGRSSALRDLDVPKPVADAILADVSVEYVHVQMVAI